MSTVVATDVRELFQDIAEAKHETVVENWRPYVEILGDLADGRPVDRSESSIVFESLSKKQSDVQSDLEIFKRRRQDAAALAKRADALRALEEAKEAKRQFDAKIEAFMGPAREEENLIADKWNQANIDMREADRAELSLCTSCFDPFIYQQIDQNTRAVRSLAAETEPIRDERAKVLRYINEIKARLQQVKAPTAIENLKRHLQTADAKLVSIDRRLAEFQPHADRLSNERIRLEALKLIP